MHRPTQAGTRTKLIASYSTSNHLPRNPRVQHGKSSFHGTTISDDIVSARYTYLTRSQSNCFDCQPPSFDVLIDMSRATILLSLSDHVRSLTQIPPPLLRTMRGSILQSKSTSAPQRVKRRRDSLVVRSGCSSAGSIPCKGA